MCELRYSMQNLQQFKLLLDLLGNFLFLEQYLHKVMSIRQYSWRQYHWQLLIMQYKLSNMCHNCKYMHFMQVPFNFVQ
jgi:hypothetical protein